MSHQFKMFRVSPVKVYACQNNAIGESLEAIIKSKGFLKIKI